MIENHCYERVGHQRNWIWRGWHIRYSYLKPAEISAEEKPPILLIHGFGASLKHWRSNLSIFAQEYRVYGIDLLGFGASDKASTVYDIKLWTELIYDFWRMVIRQPMIMVGNSLGSTVCVLTAYHHPEIVDKLVLINLPDITIRQEMIPKIAQPIVTTMESIFSRAIFLKPLFKILRQPAILKRWLNLAYVDSSKIDEELINIVAIPPQDVNADNAFVCLCQGVNNPNFCPSIKAILPKLSIPILLVWGKKDKIIPFSLGANFARLNSQIKLVELENLGHCPQDEAPEVFNKIFLDYCALKSSFHDFALDKCKS
jgi:pimeloyl-ACP methyl ester carboxylesterase